MTNAAHTEGPWTILPQNGAGPMIVHEFETGNQMNPTGYRLIAHMLQRGNSLEQDRANARLIAAAPDLITALRLVLALARIKYGNLDPDANKGFEIAEAAISRASLPA